MATPAKGLSAPSSAEAYAAAVAVVTSGAGLVSEAATESAGAASEAATELAGAVIGLAEWRLALGAGWEMWLMDAAGEPARGDARGCPFCPVGKEATLRTAVGVVVWLAAVSLAMHSPTVAIRLGAPSAGAEAGNARIAPKGSPAGSASPLGCTAVELLRVAVC